MTISKLESNKTNFQHETLDAIARAFNMAGAAELESLVTGPTAQVRRPVDDLPAEWVAFTRQVVQLDRHAQQMMLSMLIFCQDRSRLRENLPDGHHPSGGGQHHPPAVVASTAL